MVVPTIIPSVAGGTVFLVLLVLMTLVLVALVLKVFRQVHGHREMAAIISIHHHVRVLLPMILVEHSVGIVGG